MNLRCLALRCIALLGFALAASAARAQVGIYITPVANSVSLSRPDTGPFAYIGDNVTQRWFKGAAFGGYYDFATEGPVRLGADLRFRITGATTGARDNTFLVGLRASVPLTPRIRPYAELVVGVADTHSGLNPRSLERAEYGGLVGADYSLNHHLDWRAVEVGFTTYTPMNSQAFGTGDTPPSAQSVTIASGIVVRF